MKLTFSADKLSVSGPKSTDNSYVIKFETGEYERVNVAKLLSIEPGSVMKITVEVEE